MDHDIIVTAVRKDAWMAGRNRDSEVVVLCRSCVNNNVNKTNSYMQIATGDVFTVDQLNVIIVDHDTEMVASRGGRG
jgi:saccharopine dehydrogenase-like NADP-dependent oxidoreductase